MGSQPSRLRIALVGPCGSGKSTLAQLLRARGYVVREPAQEHSGVPDMWRRLVRPDVLIYLDATLATIARRRRVQWDQAYLDRLNHRLANARHHCDLYLPTDNLAPREVLANVEEFLHRSFAAEV
jgi:deoxyadenosine/deoxycytidine kinase